jgi:uncharacterized hydrophobic protein (TIGR00341 family)
MKKIEVIVSSDEAKGVEKVLDEAGLMPSTSEVKIQTEKYTLYSTLLPDELAEEVLSKLSDTVDSEKKENLISFSEIAGVKSDYLDKLKQKAAKKKVSTNPTEELIEKTDRYTHLTRDMVAITVLAAVVATAGLFLDNVVIIIGAMILPPILEPINALAVNANLGKPRKAFSSQLSVGALVVIIIAVSAAITYIVNSFSNLSITSQIISRTFATPLDLVIALVLGVAAGLVFRVALTQTLFGVAISAALLPPAAVVGIELAFLSLNDFVGALVLVLVNLFSLEFGCTLMFRLLGVSPRNYYKKGEGKRNSLYSILFLAGLLIVLGILLLIPNLVPSSR